jgi:spore coat assembly protein
MRRASYEAGNGYIGGDPVKEVRVGDIVTRRSHGEDIYFRVEAINREAGDRSALLRGLLIRLCANAPLDDLEKKNISEISLHRREFSKNVGKCLQQALSQQASTRQTAMIRSGKHEEGLNFFELPGRVLHLDGDREYRETCLHTYLQLEVPCNVFYVPEQEQPALVYRYLREERPDILVLTGHDGLFKECRDYRDLNNYRHSRFFVEAVRRAREYEPNRDDLVIIAGGCQSCYEALIEAGANFASAPDRMMIPVLDPVFIAEKIAYTSIYAQIHLPELFNVTLGGSRGIGGVQTRGQYRLGLPRPRY